MREITRSVLKFLLGFGVVLVVSALLAPWLFTFLPFKFDRIFRRLIMIGTLVLVGGLLRERRTSWKSLGLAWQEEGLRFFGSGFWQGVFLVVVLTAIQWALGVRFWRLSGVDGWHWIGFFCKGLGAGLLIGLIEESFFRGFLFLTFKDLWNTKASLVVTNLIYALVHFFPKGHSFTGAQPTVVDSFRLLSAALTPAPEQWGMVLAPMAGLFLFGLILSFAFLRTGSLFSAAGIHAGAIFGLKLNRRFAPEIAEKMNFLSGTKNLYDGVAGLSFLALCVAWFGWRTSLSKKGQP